MYQPWGLGSRVPAVYGHTNILSKAGRLGAILQLSIQYYALIYISFLTTNVQLTSIYADRVKKTNSPLGVILFYSITTV